MSYCIIVHLIPISLVCLNALSMYSFSLFLVLFGKVKKRDANIKFFLLIYYTTKTVHETYHFFMLC